MAITDNSISVVRVPTEGDWVWMSVYSADLSGAEDIIAAVTSKSHYIQRIDIYSQSVTDVTITFGADQGTGVTTTTLGPMSLPDAGGHSYVDFGPDHAMRITAGATFAVDMSAACPTAIVVKYKTAS